MHARLIPSVFSHLLHIPVEGMRGPRQALTAIYSAQLLPALPTGAWFGWHGCAGRREATAFKWRGRKGKKQHVHGHTQTTGNLRLIPSD